MNVLLFLLLWGLCHNTLCHETPPPEYSSNYPTETEIQNYLKATLRTIPYNDQEETQTNSQECTLSPTQKDFLITHFATPTPIRFPFHNDHIVAVNYNNPETIHITTEHHNNSLRNWTYNYLQNKTMLNSGKYPLLFQNYGSEEAYARLFKAAVHLTTKDNGQDNHDHVIHLPSFQDTNVKAKIGLNPFKKELVIWYSNMSYDVINFGQASLTIKKYTRTTKSHYTDIEKLFFGPNNQIGIIAHKKLHIQDLEKLSNCFHFPNNFDNLHVEFNPCPEAGQFLIQEKNKLFIHTSRTGKNIGTARFKSVPHSAHFTGTGSHLLAIDKDSLKIHVLNTQTFNADYSIVLEENPCQLFCSSLPTSNTFIAITSNGFYYFTDPHVARGGYYAIPEIKSIHFNPTFDKKILVHAQKNTLLLFDFYKENNLITYYNQLPDTQQKQLFITLIKKIIEHKKHQPIFINHPNHSTPFYRFLQTMPESIKKILKDKNFFFDEDPPDYNTVIQELPDTDYTQPRNRKSFWKKLFSCFIK